MAAKEITELLQTGGAAGDSSIGLDVAAGLVRRDLVPYDKDAAAVDSSDTDLFIGVSVSGEARTFNAIPYIKGDTAATPAVDDLVIGVGDDGSAKQFTVASLATTLEGESFGTAAFVNHGTAAGEVPLNSDLGSASLVDAGTAPDEIPLNSDLPSVEGDHIDKIDLLRSVAGVDAFDARVVNDGLSIWVLNRDSGTVDEYSMSSAYDIATMASTGVSLDASSTVGTGCTGIDVSSNGLYIYLSVPIGVFRYEMSIAFDLSTAAYSGNTTSVIGGTCVCVSADGGYMYTTDGVEYTTMLMSTPFDLSTATFSTGVYMPTAGSGGYTSIRVASNGLSAYISTTGGTLRYITTDTAFVFSGSSVTEVMEAEISSSFGIDLNPERTTIYSFNGASIEQSTMFRIIPF